MLKKVPVLIIILAIASLGYLVIDTRNEANQRDAAERSRLSSEQRIETEKKNQQLSEFTEQLNKLKSVCASDIAAYNKLPDAKPGATKVAAPDCNPNLTLPQ